MKSEWIPYFFVNKKLMYDCNTLFYFKVSSWRTESSNCPEGYVMWIWHIREKLVQFYIFTNAVRALRSLRLWPLCVVVFREENRMSQTDSASILRLKSEEVPITVGWPWSSEWQNVPTFRYSYTSLLSSISYMSNQHHRSIQIKICWCWSLVKSSVPVLIFGSFVSGSWNKRITMQRGGVCCSLKHGALVVNSPLMHSEVLCKHCARSASRRAQNAPYDLTWEGHHFGLCLFNVCTYLFIH
jgi:hypothetical protein